MQGPQSGAKNSVVLHHLQDESGNTGANTCAISMEGTNENLVKAEGVKSKAKKGDGAESDSVG